MQRPKILLVDDDADFAALARTILETRQYDVITASNGEEGLARAVAEKPDLVLLDVIMPVKDGFTVCRQLKACPDTRRIPVIMFTGFRDKAEETTVPVGQGLTLEADDYLEKPLNAALLLERVGRQLGRMQAS